MANVEHSALTGSNLHEPKGCAAAAASTVYIADGAGSGSFTTISNASLASAAKAFQAQLLHVREVQAQNVASTTTTTNGSYVRAVLNTVVTNEITSASLATNQITLPAGTYFLEATYNVGDLVDSMGRLRFRNMTDGTTSLLGPNFDPDSTSTPCYAIMKGRFTLSGTKAMELQFRCGNTTTGSAACNFTGESEIYNEVFIWKVA